MRISVINLLYELQSKLLGHVGVLSYQYCQLCVKAEGSSLLPIEVNAGASVLKMEDLAHVFIYEDDEVKKYEMDLYPKSGGYLQLIVQGILQSHPEFHIEIKKIDENVEDEDDVPENKYIHVTMPEVNKERRDILNQGVDFLYNKCKVNMDACLAKCTADITKRTVTDDPSALDEAKAKVDELKEKFFEIREQLTEDKKKEIEDAYQRYLAKQDEKNGIKPQNGNDGKTTIAEEMPKEDKKVAETPKEKKKPEEKPEESKESKNPFEGVGQSLSME